MWHEKMPMSYRNKIVTGDCRELAKRIPDDSVDLIFTSPPYNLGIDYGVWDDEMDQGEFWAFQKTWTRDTFRIAADKSRMYVVVSDKMLWEYRGMAEDVGWKFHQLLVWCKPNFVAAKRNSGDFNKMAEWGLLFHKGKRTPMQSSTIGATTHNWIVAAYPQSNYSGQNKKQFPAQWPIELPLAWQSRTPSEIVYDPFAGSGTGLMAAKMLGKNYIAFEIDPDTAELARNRVRETQPPLFVEQPEQLELREKYG